MSKVQGIALAIFVLFSIANSVLFFLPGEPKAKRTLLRISLLFTFICFGVYLFAPGLSLKPVLFYVGIALFILIVNSQFILFCNSCGVGINNTPGSFGFRSKDGKCWSCGKPVV